MAALRAGSVPFLPNVMIYIHQLVLVCSQIEPRRGRVSWTDLLCHPCCFFRFREGGLDRLVVQECRDQVPILSAFGAMSRYS